MSGENEERDEADPIGWDAIDEALAPVYGDREPQHYATVLPAMLGGDDPLQGISVYKNLTPEPHYHFVTYGFTELYEKESDDPEYSGFGFELTFRLSCAADASEEPPAWPLNFLQNLARYVFSTGNAFDERHHMTLNGPIAHGEETEITAILLIADPQLPEMETKNGRAKFLQIVGLAGDEYGLVQEGYFDQIASRVTDLMPLAITDIHRASLLKDEATLEAITSEEPTLASFEVFGTVAEWEEADGELTLKIGATIIPHVKRLLEAQLGQGEPMIVYGKGTVIAFEAADANSWKIEDDVRIVSMTPQTATSFANTLEPHRGKYQDPSFSGLTIEVVPIDIKDNDGEVIRTVG